MELLTSDVLTRRQPIDDRTSCREPANRFYISIYIYTYIYIVVYIYIVMYIVIYICICIHYIDLYIAHKDWDTKSWLGS